MDLVAVVMGGESSAARFEGAKKLLDYGFSNFSFEKIETEFKNGTEISVKGGAESRVALKAAGNCFLLLKKGDREKITQKVNLPKSVSAPVKKGDKIGEIEVFSGESLVGTIDITAKESVEKMRYSTALLRLIKGLFTA